METMRIYLDTSVWNFYFAADAPDKRDATVAFFDQLAFGYFEIFISPIVYREISAATEAKRQALSGLIEFHHPTSIELSDEIAELAAAYHAEGAIPPSMPEDALHIACATVAELDAVISWNMRHIANLRRQEKIQRVNFMKGYHKVIYLITPLEVFYNE